VRKFLIAIVFLALPSVTAKAQTPRIELFTLRQKGRLHGQAALCLLHVRVGGSDSQCCMV
jgi:hypothetical protein